MKEIDYSVETEEETDEDAFIAAPSDEEVKELYNYRSKKFRR